MNPSPLTFCPVALVDIQRGGVIHGPWREAPSHVGLPDHEVHLWLANVEQQDGRPESFQHLLSEPEKTCAAKFHFERDRIRYTARHVVLRQLTGQYLQRTPNEIRFVENSFGKPGLTTDSVEGLEFNLSKSEEWAAYGFVLRRRIGIDVEKVRRDFDCEGIVTRFFHPREAMYIAESPPRSRAGRFFACWTLKEAFIKAQGVGLQRPLVEFDLSPLVREGSGEFTDRDGSKWLCATVDPVAELAAGVVVES